MSMFDMLIEEISKLPQGSKAPHVVSAIMEMNDLSFTAKTTLANLFLVLYRELVATDPCSD